MSLKIRRAEDESGSAARGGEDKKILKGVESHRKNRSQAYEGTIVVATISFFDTLCGEIWHTEEACVAV